VSLQYIFGDVIIFQSAFAHGAGFGVITFMLKPNSLDQLTVISSGVSSEHTKESIEAMKDLLLGSSKILHQHTISSSVYNHSFLVVH